MDSIPFLSGASADKKQTFYQHQDVSFFRYFYLGIVYSGHAIERN